MEMKSIHRLAEYDYRSAIFLFGLNVQRLRQSCFAVMDTHNMVSLPICPRIKCLY